MTKRTTKTTVHRLLKADSIAGLARRLYRERDTINDVTIVVSAGSDLSIWYTGCDRVEVVARLAIGQHLAISDCERWLRPADEENEDV